jgi:hypothetical protein
VKPPVCASAKKQDQVVEIQKPLITANKDKKVIWHKPLMMAFQDEIVIEEDWLITFEKMAKKDCITIEGCNCENIVAKSTVVVKVEKPNVNVTSIVRGCVSHNVDKDNKVSPPFCFSLIRWFWCPHYV